MNRFEMPTQSKGSDEILPVKSPGETAYDHLSVKTIENYALVTRLPIPKVSIAKSMHVFYRKGGKKKDLERDPCKIICRGTFIGSPTF